MAKDAPRQLHAKTIISLVCKSGTCQCETTAYWNGSACLSKYTYKQSCTSDTYCLTSLMLNCDTKTKTCLCNSTRYLIITIIDVVTNNFTN